MPRHANTGTQVELPRGPVPQDQGSHASCGENGHAEDIVFGLRAHDFGDVNGQQMAGNCTLVVIHFIEAKHINPLDQIH